MRLSAVKPGDLVSATNEHGEQFVARVEEVDPLSTTPFRATKPQVIKVSALDGHYRRLKGRKPQPGDIIEANVKGQRFLARVGEMTGTNWHIEPFGSVGRYSVRPHEVAVVYRRRKG